jgi:hypothetical protein
MPELPPSPLGYCGFRPRGALEWLAQACADHEFLMVYAKVVPTLDSVRSDPKSRQLLGGSCAVTAGADD